MVNKMRIQLRMRLAGLLASIIAVAALAVTVLAGNHNAGFGHIVTGGEQMFLFVIASLLLVAQTIANSIHRARRTKHGTDRTMTAARCPKNRPWGEL
jgi:hypothetical protein